MRHSVRKNLTAGSPNNAFNPVRRYHPENPLNPANKYSSNVPFAPLDGDRGKRLWRGEFLRGA